MDSISDQIRELSDIMVDGTQNAADTCNGISTGIGFKAKPAQIGSVARPSTPPPNPC